MFFPKDIVGCRGQVQLGGSAFNKFENEKISNQYIGFIKCCDQSGNRVFQNDKIYHIWTLGVL